MGSNVLGDAIKAAMDALADPDKLNRVKAMQALGNAIEDYYVPRLVGVAVGSMVAYGATGSVPTDWLLCDGSAVSRVTYADLFSVIGTTWGAGDGSTTFNLPNSISIDSKTLSHTKVGRAAQQNLANGAVNLIQWDTVMYDANSDWDAGNYRFVAPADGYYHWDMGFLFLNQVVSVSSVWVGYIYKNGVAHTTFDRRQGWSTVTKYPALLGSGTIYLEANDYIDLRIYIVSFGTGYTYPSVAYCWWDIDQLVKENSGVNYIIKAVA